MKRSASKNCPEGTHAGGLGLQSGLSGMPEIRLELLSDVARWVVSADEVETADYDDVFVDGNNNNNATPDRDKENVAPERWSGSRRHGKVTPEVVPNKKPRRSGGSLAVPGLIPAEPPPGKYPGGPSVTAEKPYSPFVAVCVNSPGRRKLQERGLDDLARTILDSNGGEVKLLGKGSYGTVVLGTWKGNKVAVKVIPGCPEVGGTPGRPEACGRNRRRGSSLDSELNATKLDHENVIKVHGVFDARNDDALISSVIIMEYVGSCNLQYVLEHQSFRIDRRFLRRALTQIAKGLSHCHERWIIHLDIKPGNILLAPGNSDDSNGVVFKIGDFGCSRIVGHQSVNGATVEVKEFHHHNELVGTPGYQAPELLTSSAPITTKCDVFSYGVLAWQLVEKQPCPFPGMHMHTIIFKVVSESLRPEDLFPKAGNVGDPDEDASHRQLYRSCWQGNPARRPSMAQVLDILQKAQPRQRTLSTQTSASHSPRSPAASVGESNKPTRRSSSNIRM